MSEMDLKSFVLHGKNIIFGNLQHFNNLKDVYNEIFACLFSIQDNIASSALNTIFEI